MNGSIAVATYRSKSFEIDLNGERLSYVVEKRPRRKKVTLRMIEGQLTIRIPEHATYEVGVQAALNHTHWIQKERARFAQFKQLLPPSFQFHEEARLPFNGRTFPIHLSVGVKRSVRLDYGVWHMTKRHNDTFEQLFPYYRKEVERLGRQIVDDMIQSLAPTIGRFPSNVSFRKQKKRWGTCTSKGHLLFNWRILLAPSSIIRHVVIHEMAHLREMNHGPRFWQLVHAVDCTSEQSKQWLARYGRTLYFFEN